jgi:hypothetical protein
MAFLLQSMPDAADPPGLILSVRAARRQRAAVRAAGRDAARLLRALKERRG